METISREELNTQAHLLAVRVHSIVTAGRSLDPEVELRIQCEQIEESIRKIKLECSKLPELPKFEDEECSANQMLQQRLLQTELDLWTSQQPNVLSKNESVIEAISIQQVNTNVDGLVTTLSALKDEKITTIRELDRERGLLEESRQIEKALTEKLFAIPGRGSPDVTESPGMQVEERLARGQQSCDSLKDRLEWFVQHHLPAVEDIHNTRKRKKRTGSSNQTSLDSLVHNTPSQQETDYPGLDSVIQDLIVKYLENQHNPYVSVKTIWPPHFQLLLRSGIVQRHPDNSDLIHITPFHH